MLTFQYRRPGLGKRVNAGETLRFTHINLGQGTHDSLIGEGCIQDKSRCVTIDTGASKIIARPDIVAGQPEGKPSRAHVLQTACGETIPVMI
jgi:hypothetical protein